jgi:hypothetical protein
MAAMLCVLSCSHPAEKSQVPPPATGVTQNLRRVEAPSPFFAMDRLCSVSDPYSKPSVEIHTSDSLTSAGWAVDSMTRSAARDVDFVIDGIAYSARYGTDRPDVAIYFKTQACLKSGFDFSMPASLLAVGMHTVTVRVVPAGGKVYYEGPRLTLLVK